MVNKEEAKKSLAQDKANELGIDVDDGAVMENAEIEDVSIKFGRGTFLTLSVALNYEGGGHQSYGGTIVLDAHDDSLGERVGTEFGCQAIRRMVHVFDGNELRDAVGKNARAIHTRSRVFAIGHAVRDRWHAFKRINQNYDADV